MVVQAIYRAEEMKVVHIGVSASGGAGIAMLRIHNALIEQGVDSSVLTMLPDENSFCYFVEKAKLTMLEYFRMAFYPAINRMKLLGRTFKPEMFSSPYSLLHPEQYEIVKQADVIHLHWVSHFIDWKSFFGNIDKPVVWTLHDANAFTGGCHIALDCQGYQSDCSNCPQTKGNLYSNYAKMNLKNKIDSIQRFRDLSIVCPSEWLQTCAANSSLFKDLNSRVINNCIDDSWGLLDKQTCRKELDLPRDKKILLFVAEDISKEFKGFDILVRALESFYREDILLLTIGNLSDSIDVAIPHKHMGYIASPSKLNMIYSAADALVHPSQSENFPNIIMEAQASGTPAIAFAVGGIPEMIENNRNGLLAQEVNPNGLAEAISSFFDKGIELSNEEISSQAKERYNRRLNAQKYVELYRELTR
jgi:glycosyltransferase involved in cell wall biosynthesis